MRLCIYVCMCEWVFMGNAVMHFARRDFSPIAPAVVVWPGAMGRHGGFRWYIHIPHHYV
ncbi:hypothetical protein HanXRQr2_Chr17g0805531 [Helianthus annuus]|uniref:Uncharacterized protein n=1 Tax=Helianthus annuus TaxID=4232 RepID=A0A9K3GTZ7_HELAN|nr:hypothetical protein HanXRQr2_Chr17g0805531 [Helianthus annuus]KAJ0433766.1 hypothetical protein HanIR_Chr17g0873911 [Helianthus annuus]KAJ0813400.1 hypothetical protein HanPSC8_Chr17g0772981 [Helianthus annuus]